MQKKKINSGEAKEQLLAYFQNDLLEFIQHSEFKAALTHFIHNPDICPPFMDRLTHDWLRNFFYTDSQVIKTLVSAKEDQRPWQAAFPFIKDEIPYKPSPNPKFTFIDLFAGIGGFRIAFQEVGGKCVFTSEWDKHAKKTYDANFGEVL